MLLTARGTTVCWLLVAALCSRKSYKHAASLAYNGYLKDDNRRHSAAARAGTRGFRAPEVLLQCKDQSPAIDVWSAGVVLLSFLSARCPYFQSNCDEDAIVELGETFGVDELKHAAKELGKQLTTGYKIAKLPSGLKRTTTAKTLEKICRSQNAGPHRYPNDVNVYKFVSVPAPRQKPCFVARQHTCARVCTTATISSHHPRAL